MVRRQVVGSYDSETEAIAAIEDLKRQGDNSDEISVVSKHSGDVEHITAETDTHVVEGATTGAATGGVLGGLGGVLLGVGALAIPGIGPIIAGVTGAAAGAGVGGLAGALIGMGIPEDEAQQYDERFNEGKILVFLDGDYEPSGSLNRPYL